MPKNLLLSVFRICFEARMSSFRRQNCWVEKPHGHGMEAAENRPTVNKVNAAA
jgi:hypothetical protein